MIVTTLARLTISTTNELPRAVPRTEFSLTFTSVTSNADSVLSQILVFVQFHKCIKNTCFHMRLIDKTVGESSAILLMIKAPKSFTLTVARSFVSIHLLFWSQHGSLGLAIVSSSVGVSNCFPIRVARSSAVDDVLAILVILDVVVDVDHRRRCAELRLEEVAD